MTEEGTRPARTGWRSWSRRKKIAIFGGIAIMVLALSTQADPNASETPTNTASPSAQPASTQIYTLAIEAVAQGASSVDVSGTTNLPVGGVVQVFASRALRYQGETDTRSTNIASAEVTLSGNAFTVTLALDESNLVVGVDPSFALEIVDEDIVVCAQFETGTDLDGVQAQHDPAVVAAVGAFGELLATSPQVTVFGSATDHPANWLETQVDLALESPLLAEIEGLQGSPVGVGPLEGFCV